MNYRVEGACRVNAFKLAVVVIALLVMNVGWPVETLLVFFAARGPFLELILTKVDIPALAGRGGAFRLLGRAE